VTSLQSFLSFNYLVIFSQFSGTYSYFFFFVAKAAKLLIIAILVVNCGQNEANNKLSTPTKKCINKCYSGTGISAGPGAPNNLCKLIKIMILLLLFIRYLVINIIIS
jgi:hypothetical protein